MWEKSVSRSGIRYPAIANLQPTSGVMAVRDPVVDLPIQSDIDLPDSSLWMLGRFVWGYQGLLVSRVREVT
jgi:hypothetical protein